MVIILLFILGISVGSFLNVVIDRLPKNESVILGRSCCDFCRHLLYWYDLIPLFSFIFLWGKCRYCGKNISLQYPLVEFITGALFLYTYYATSMYQYIDIVIVSGLLVIFVSDLKYRIIPDQVLIFLLLFTFLFYLFTQPANIIDNLNVALLIGAFFLFLVLITRGRGMGLGDVKYAFVMGFILGYPKIVIAFYLSFLTGAIVSLILVVKAKKKMKSTIAFGPFLAFATFVSYFYGDQLWAIFKKIIGL